jgi:hypothetical protein
MVCFDGPDRGKGFVILCNGDNPAVYLQCELARLLLSQSGGKGILRCIVQMGCDFDE